MAKQKSKAVKTGQETNKPAPTPPVQPVNSEFENKLQTVGSQAGTQEPNPERIERRGGARPGAGRPTGLTDNMSRINSLPDVPNKAIANSIQIPFEWWAISQKIKELALSDDEAEDIALPVTQLLAYYFPGAEDHIAFVWLSLTGVASRLVTPRLKILAEVREKKPAGKSSVAEGAGGGAANSSVPTPSSSGGFPQR